MSIQMRQVAFTIQNNKKQLKKMDLQFLLNENKFEKLKTINSVYC